ncbi:MAG: hypothetical protein HWD58_12995 [Bacteroidota bacterium]|nr:MAG: hypothetical protein HWD58_12995 [Bacteroidota bacterium]
MPQERCGVTLNQWFGQFEEFHSHTPTIQIWADCYAWDWMLFCDIFKHALNLPKAIHYMPMDLATWLQSLGINPDAQRDSIVEYTVPVSGLHQHHALYDALLERACFLKYNHEARIPI